MKRPIIAALAALALGTAAPVFAQAPVAAPAPPAHAPRGGGRLQKMAAELNLTDAQKAQMKPILQNSRRQMQALRADAALTPDARMAKRKAIGKNTRTQMMAILTPAQRAQLKTIQRQNRAAKAANG